MSDVSTNNRCAQYKLSCVMKAAKQSRESVMEIIRNDNRAPYGTACTECNDLLVAPKWSAYVSKHEVRHFWSCENCGREIEMTVNPRIKPIETQPGR